jgi:DedD protein
MADRAEATEELNALRRQGRRRLVGAIALVLVAAIVLPIVFDPDPKPNLPPVSVKIPGEDESKFVPRTNASPTPRVEESAPASAAPPAEPAKSADVTPVEATKPSAPVPATAMQPAPSSSAVAKSAEPLTKSTETTKSAKSAKGAEPTKAAEPAKAAEPTKATKAAEPTKTASTTESSTAAQFFVQAGAFVGPDKVREVTDQLKAAKLTYYTETVATTKGTVTRIRLGPYETKAAAEKAAAAAKRLGLNPGSPVAK